MSLFSCYVWAWIYRLRPERPTVRRLLSHSTAFRRRFDKGGHRRIAEPFDPQRVVGAVLVDLADEAIEPQPPHKIALREADRVVFRRSQRAGVMVLPTAVLSSPVDHRLRDEHRVGLAGVERGDHGGEAGNFDNCCLW